MIPGHNGHEIAASIRTHVDEALGELQQHFNGREELMRKTSAHQEKFCNLQEELRTCNVRVSEAESQISAARQSENELKEENATMQRKIEALQSNDSPTQDVQVQVITAKAELERTVKALSAAKKDLTNKAEELRTLSTTNASLEEKLQTLEDRFDELQNRSINFDQDQARLDRKAKEIEDNLRKETAAHVEQFRTQTIAQNSNDLKKVTSERDRFEKQLKPLREELTGCQANNQLLQEKLTASTRQEQELKQINSLVESQKKQIGRLQTSLNEHKGPSMDESVSHEKLLALETQLSDNKFKLKELVEEKSVLLKQVEDLRATAEKASLAEKNIKAEVEKLRSGNNDSIAALEKEVRAAKSNAQRSAAGMEHLKESCKKAIDDEESKNGRQMEALQEELSREQVELQKAKHDNERFRAEVEASWQLEQTSNEEKSAAMSRQVAEAEAQRDEALANNERLRQDMQTAMNEQRDSLMKQLEQEKQRATAAENKENKQPLPAGEQFNISSQLRDGITPAASRHAVEPTRPRKKADRDSNTIVEVGPIPAPEEIRPDSRKTNSAGGKESVLGPVVEESQFSINPFGGQIAAVTGFPKETSSMSMLSDNEDMLTVRDVGFQQLPRTVEETQSGDILPSFAAFNSSIASAQAPHTRYASSIVQGHATSGRNEQRQHERSALRGLNSQEPLADFAIYEDSQRSQAFTHPQDLEDGRQLQDRPSWSQAEKENYTFQKSFPHPNSASKRVHAGGSQSSSQSRHGSGSQRNACTGDSTLNAPTSNKHAQRVPFNAGVTSNARSSSPHFIYANKANGRKMSTYQSPGAPAGQRHLPRTNSGSSADPRLIGRSQPTGMKRKGEGQIVEGYEHERKKRLAASSTATQPKDRITLRSHSQPSVNDLPRFPMMHSGRRISQSESSNSGSQSRMRTLAGRSSRATRGGKKVSKSKFTKRNEITTS